MKLAEKAGRAEGAPVNLAGWFGRFAGRVLTRISRVGTDGKSSAWVAFERPRDVIKFGWDLLLWIRAGHAAMLRTPRHDLVTELL